MNPSEAEEHLRVIRRLMERATIYRAISAPTALVGGIVSLATGLAMHFLRPMDASEKLGGSEALLFLCVWLAVLCVTGFANVCFLAREARQRGGSFVSPGMRKALGSIFPAFLAAGILTPAIGLRGPYFVLPVVWMILYGLALLAAAQFSPQAIPRLGWAFLICGLAGAILFFANLGGNILGSPHLLMAMTFGGLHLLYAVLTWTTEGRDEAAHV